MDQTKIDRINALAGKARSEGLTVEETEEQKRLRSEYVAAFRNNLEAMLEQTYLMDEEGNKTKLGKGNHQVDEDRRCAEGSALSDSGGPCSGSCDS